MTSENQSTRREALGAAVRGVGFLGVGGALAYLSLQDSDTSEMKTDNWVWQIDPAKCIQSRAANPEECGKCATECVLTPSAVKAVHKAKMCGYCELCFGYFHPDYDELNTGAENQMCPTGAIIRNPMLAPYHEYVINEALCIACGKCVAGCNTFGNGSLFFQIRHTPEAGKEAKPSKYIPIGHSPDPDQTAKSNNKTPDKQVEPSNPTSRDDTCLNCNQCSIAEQCPGDAFVRVPRDKPYLFRG